ncbi:hypothetical protein DPMN_091096 [Dreissena polymorpha]|uniref:Uncharacterized protein n=1 Tax=Dreissena polymorpha TaxID=45954 RepID=A0A9D4QYU6_DREPO|nr:hypothetical protein DPMN_091096 [Dreissena polymorpha]
MIARVIILVMAITEVYTEQILVNHGIQFSDPKPIHFVKNNWAHTFEFKIPDYNFDTELVNEFLCVEMSAIVTIKNDAHHLKDLMVLKITRKPT